MVSRVSQDLPRQLDDGLLLRWADAADADELADFNLRWHSDDPEGQPEIWLQDWTRNLLSPQHPTTDANSVTVVTDLKERNKIVSSMVMIPQQWAYNGISFECGRPELIATEPEYRRRGLVRRQMELFHAQSSTRGDMIQAIIGIPWYYRQFNYEMALDHGGGRRLPNTAIREKPADEIEQYRWRKATMDDLPFLEKMYEQLGNRSLVTCLRSRSTWQYELDVNHLPLDGRRNLWIVQTVPGKPVAYADVLTFPRAETIRELEVAPGYPVREIALFLARQLKHLSLQKEMERGQLSGLTLKLGAKHPVYEALIGELASPLPTYAWYIRVPDLPRFLWHIRPVLEERLSASVIAGFDGLLKLNFYQDQLKLVFSGGQLVNIEPYMPEHFFDGDAFFRELTFLQLLFGYRTMDEINYAQVDCFAKTDDTGVLLQTLFPKIPSKVVPLS